MKTKLKKFTKPQIIKTIAEFKAIRKKIGNTQSLGFVPTMGYLHQGHLSLVEAARRENSAVAVSIYVNPTQFGENEDFDSYPSNIEKDIELLSEYETDYVFLPTSAEMYPENFSTFVNVEHLTEHLCGTSRPGHFRGVTTIVNKLINIVKPDNMYMGDKDFQQIAVIRRMTEDLNLDVNVKSCPVIREKDGLAMSSRNSYLSEEERINALCLYKSLLKAKDLIGKGIIKTKLIIPEMEKIIFQNKGKIDYIEFVNNINLQNVTVVNKSTRILLAVKIGSTRLIDNMKAY
ncbi:MAG: pantoate--beta-alanine ligase [Candidatus Cloacimonadota bacterium]|nr:MAG: pantoate--beta-alanine ligase [Candidatus Cloacimonadota bacterium]